MQRLGLSGHLTGWRVAAFVDGEMAAPELDEWRHHLQWCWSCHCAVSAERGMRDRVRFAAVPTPPAALLQSLRVVAEQPVRVSGPALVAPRGQASAELRRGVPRRAVMGLAAVTTSATLAATSFAAFVPAGERATPQTPQAPAAAAWEAGAWSRLSASGATAFQPGVGTGPGSPVLGAFITATATATAPTTTAWTSPSVGASASTRAPMTVPTSVSAVSAPTAAPFPVVVPGRSR